MRLINARTLKIEEFVGSRNLRYAILSHTWGDEEVTFQDWHNISEASQKTGFAKIQGACNQALVDNLEYVWVDTNCINKDSSAELSEAINSMFSWYQNAVVCYVYLADAPDDAARLNDEGRLGNDDPFLRCKWFMRGWTLQELLAPSRVVFFSVNWVLLGTKLELAIPLAQITGIPVPYITMSRPIWLASISRRMSWMSKRITTRIEDMAYAMLGIFDINMPLLYGEGNRAFVRLQEEIIKTTDDQTIFCWEWNPHHVPNGWASVLAPCPIVFEHSSELFPTHWDDDFGLVPYNLTNVGLSIKLQFVQTGNPNLGFGVLQVRHEWVRGDWDADFPYSQQLCIPVEKSRIYRRIPFPKRPFPIYMAAAGEARAMYLMSRERSPELSRGYISMEAELVALHSSPDFDYGFLLTFNLEDSQDITAELCHHTPGVAFIDNRSLLCFRFDEMHKGQTFAAGIIKVSQSDGVKCLALLALRKEAGETQRMNSYCQVLPDTYIAANVPGGWLAALVREAESCSEEIRHDIDFSSDGLVSLTLGNQTRYSYPRAGYRGFVRIVHVVSGDPRRGAALRESAECMDTLIITQDLAPSDNE